MKLRSYDATLKVKDYEVSIPVKARVGLGLLLLMGLAICVSVCIMDRSLEVIFSIGIVVIMVIIAALVGYKRIKVVDGRVYISSFPFVWKEYRFEEFKFICEEWQAPYRRRSRSDNMVFVGCYIYDQERREIVLVKKIYTNYDFFMEECLKHAKYVKNTTPKEFRATKTVKNIVKK